MDSIWSFRRMVNTCGQVFFVMACLQSHKAWKERHLSLYWCLIQGHSLIIVVCLLPVYLIWLRIYACAEWEGLHKRLCLRMAGLRFLLIHLCLSSSLNQVLKFLPKGIEAARARKTNLNHKQAHEDNNTCKLSHLEEHQKKSPLKRPHQPLLPRK